MTLNEKTKVPLSLAIGLLTAAVPAIFFLATARNDMLDQQERLVKLERNSRGVERVMAEMQSDLAVIRTQMEFQSDSLKEMRDELRAHDRHR